MDFGILNGSDCGFVLPEGRVVFCEAYGDRSFHGDRAPIHLSVDAPAANGCGGKARHRRERRLLVGKADTDDFQFDSLAKRKAAPISETPATVGRSMDQLERPLRREDPRAAKARGLSGSISEYFTHAAP
jgi:hypothetical protein